MALIVCPECKANVSDQADVCPKCGFKLKLSQTGWLWAVGFFFISVAIGKITNNPYNGLGAFIGMVIVAIIRMVKRSNLQMKIEQANPKVQEKPEVEEPEPVQRKKVNGTPCEYCGGVVEIGAQFCGDCGKKQRVKKGS